MNGVPSHSNISGDPVGNDIPSFDHTVAQADIENTSSACEGEIDLNLRDVGERWGDRCSDEKNQTSGDDGELDDAIRCQDKALAVVAHAESLEALAVEQSYSDRDEKDAKSLIEEKLFEIAEKLGISMWGKTGALRRLILEMVEEEAAKCKVVNVSTNKSKAKRELDKLACSINNDKANSDRQNGVKLLGL